MTAVEDLSRTILLCRDYVANTLGDEEICRDLQSVRVLCLSDLCNISSPSGQTALVTLVSLLSRMGMQVALHIPELPMLPHQPPLSGLFLRKALIASSERSITGTTVRCASSLDADLMFVLGDTDVGQRSAWRLSGGDWHGALAWSRIPVARWTATWTVGSMVSAALAAAEAFKFAIRRMPFRNRNDYIFFEASPSCSWDFGPLPTPQREIDLGQVDIISAGAICQAALYALVRMPYLRMQGRIFDDDVTARSNLNRNMLTLVDDVDSKKVLVAARTCADKFQLEPVAERFSSTGVGGGTLAPRVVVGVDDIPSRWEAQRDAHGWLGVSGTSHFGVSSSVHRKGDPCCGCLHPVDDPAGPNPLPTVSFVSFWAGLALAVRLVGEAICNVHPPDRQHLWLAPLRMDQPHAAVWCPVALRQDCPVRCSSAR